MTDNLHHYAIVRTKDLRPTRIFSSLRDANDFLMYDHDGAYRIERCYYQPHSHGHLLIAFVDREDNPLWSPQDLFRNKKLVRAKIRTTPRAIREFAYGTYMYKKAT